MGVFGGGGNAGVASPSSIPYMESRGTLLIRIESTDDRRVSRRFLPDEIMEMMARGIWQASTVLNPTSAVSHSSAMEASANPQHHDGHRECPLGQPTGVLILRVECDAARLGQVPRSWTRLPRIHIISAGLAVDTDRPSRREESVKDEAEGRMEHMHDVGDRLNEQDEHRQDGQTKVVIG